MGCPAIGLQETLRSTGCPAIGIFECSDVSFVSSELVSLSLAVKKLDGMGGRRRQYQDLLRASRLLYPAIRFRYC